MSDHGGEYRQQNRSQANQQSGSQAGQENQVSHQNYSQADQKSPFADQYNTEVEGGEERHQDEQHDNFNRKNRRLKFTKDGKLESPLVGTIRRGTIGGIGEKGFTESITPTATPTVEKTPFMGKEGSKIPFVREIQNISISGLGERGFAPSYVGKEKIPLVKLGSLGLHDCIDKPKFNKKSKKHFDESGNKFGKNKSANYMNEQKMAGVQATKQTCYFGHGKGHSTVGTVTCNTVKVQPGNPLGLGSVRNNKERPNSGGQGSHFGGTMSLRTENSEERDHDPKSRLPSRRKHTSLFRFDGI